MGAWSLVFEAVLGIAPFAAIWIFHRVRERRRERKLEQQIKQAGDDKDRVVRLLDSEMAQRRAEGEGNYDYRS